MIAKQLETILGEEFEIGDAEMVQRFQRLRDINLLPTSRGRNAEDVTAYQAAMAILAMVDLRVGYAGLAAKILRDLRPVGGPEASIGNAPHFGEALQLVLLNKKMLDTVQEVRVTFSKVGTNSPGRGAIFVKEGDQERAAWFVHETALSLMTRGAELTYNPRDTTSSVLREFVISPRLLRRIWQRLHDDARMKADAQPG